jgi:hypothetical protein
LPNLPETLDFDEVGGAKVNYSDPARADTDMDAVAGNLTRLATASMTRTADRAFVKFIWTGSAVTLLASDAVLGNDDTVTPVVTRTGTGVYLVTFPSTVTDELDVVHSVNLRIGLPSLENSTLQVSLEINSPTTATFRLTNPETAAATDLVNHAIVGVFK